MRLCLLVLATAALTHAALAADVSSEAYKAAGITSSNYPKQISKGAKAVIDSVRQALGSSDVQYSLDSNPNPPVESPPIKVPATVTAEWHNIARPAGATCAVRVHHNLMHAASPASSCPLTMRRHPCCCLSMPNLTSRTFCTVRCASPYSQFISELQVALKPYLIYSDAYEYVSPDFSKSPTAAQVPTSYRGAVDLTLFSAGDTITVCPPVKQHQYSAGFLMFW